LGAKGCYSSSANQSRADCHRPFSGASTAFLRVQAGQLTFSRPPAPPHAGRPVIKAPTPSSSPLFPFPPPPSSSAPPAEYATTKPSQATLSRLHLCHVLTLLLNQLAVAHVVKITVLTPFCFKSSRAPPQATPCGPPPSGELFMVVSSSLDAPGCPSAHRLNRFTSIALGTPERRLHRRCTSSERRRRSPATSSASLPCLGASS
jgi:hypothetical protein